MILDNNLSFVSSAQTITSSVASTTWIDLTGFSSGAQTFTTPNLNWGTGTAYDEDMGIGDGEALPKFICYVGTAFTTSNNATLTIQFQGSPDSGSNTPSAWTTYAEIPTLSASQLIAGAKFGLDYPRVPSGVSYPRFIRLYWQVNTGAFTTGTIVYAGLTLAAADEYPMSQFSRNFTVAA